MKLFSLFLITGCVGLCEITAVAAEPIPNDPQYSTQWNLSRIGAPAVWSVSTGNRDLVIALIDTGVDYENADLAANIWRNPGETGIDGSGNDKATNGIDDDGNGYVDDLHGADVLDGDGDPMEVPLVSGGQTFYHGTHVAGILGAVGNNSIGTVGVNWETSIMVLRAFPLFSEDYTEADYVGCMKKSLEYVLAMKRRGVNVVVTCNSYFNASYSQEIKDLINELGKEEVLNVFAAGNATMNNDDVAFYPNNYNEWSIISVCNVARDDVIAPVSNYGKSAVELGAPGREIQTVYSYDFRGTSAACPHVAGSVALLKAAAPNATAMEIRAALLGSVDPLVSLVGKAISNGRLNVGRALSMLQGIAAVPIVVEMSPSGPHVRNPEKITVIFNQEMNPSSVESAFQITPSTGGRFEWSNNFRTVDFIPANGFPLVRHTAKIGGAALAASGTPLDGNFSRTIQGAGADDFRWTFDFALANDDFAGAQLIDSESGLISASNRYASPETTEPDHARIKTSGPSVWYTWTASRDFWVTFQTTNTTFDTILAAYTGDDIAALSPVAANDNLGSTVRSRVSFAATSGAKYFIVVAGKSVDENKAELSAASFGNFQLRWDPTPVPTISSFTPTTAYVGQKITVNGNYFTSATNIFVNGVEASFTLSTAPTTSDTLLTFIVPIGASTGPLVIASGTGRNASAQNLNVLIPPTLTIQAAPIGMLQISWPETAAFTLQRSSGLDSSNWTTAESSSSILQNGTRMVILPMGSEVGFFRLIRP